MTDEGANVVVGVDGSESGLRATAWAAQTAAQWHRPLLLTSVLTPPTPYGTGIGLRPDRFVELETEGRAWLDEARAVAERTVAGLDRTEVETELVVGGVSEVLSERAREAFRVVVGGDRPAGETGTSASTAVALLSHTSCPLAVVRWGGDENAEPPRHGPVVVGVDGSPASAEAMLVAFEEAATLGSTLVAVHVEGSSARQRLRGRHRSTWHAGEVTDRMMLTERFAGMRQWYPEVDVEPVVTRGGPTPTLLKHAESARLLVVGTSGHAQLGGRLLGSTSHALVRSAPCPLLIVPDPARTPERHARWREKTGS
ncbi:universal stress protein [Saccharomonospora sp.]|uniref:universal stress protein n=1 Tax=Saccharomonospora sp. TaxID=33913 RepID=UPI0026081D3E|nr:universal stress protein [Saccharomonospora sp.]